MSNLYPRAVNGPATVVTPEREAPRFWNMATVGEDEAEIILYGEVCSSRPIDWWTGEPVPGNFITPEGFMEDLERIQGAKNITIKLNSVGGDAYTGIAIHNAIKALPASKTCVVEGLAASAGSVIMCAADTVEVFPGSLVMIHGVAGRLNDFYDIHDLKNIIKGWDAVEEAVAEIYSAKTGTDVDSLRGTMTREKWMTGRQAVDNGFADKLREGTGPEMALENRDTLLVNGVRHCIQGLHLPSELNIPTVSPSASAQADGNIPRPAASAGATQKGGTTNMAKPKNPNQLPAQTASPAPQNTTPQGDAVPQAAAPVAPPVDAAAAAVEAERQRLRDIDEIAGVIGDQELINAAKYGDTPMTAAELALAATKRQAQLGGAYMQSMQADFNESGAAEVSGAPVNTTGQPSVHDDVADAVALFNTVKGRV